MNTHHHLKESRDKSHALTNLRSFCSRYLPEYIEEFGWYKEPDRMIQEGYEYAQATGLKSYIALFVPPGWGKTRGVTVPIPAKRIAKDRTHRVGLFSKSQKKSENYMRATARILKNPELVEDCGVFLDTSDLCVANTEKIIVLGAEDIETSPTITNLGMSSQVESVRFHTMILDDPIDREIAFSEAEVGHFISRMKNTFLPRLEPGGQMILIGSRFGLMDGYHWILKNPVFKSFILPALDENEQTTCIERYSTEAVLQMRDGLRETEVGDIVESSGDWLARFMQAPMSGSEMAFQLDWIKEEEKWTDQEPEGKISGIDPAYSTAKEADYTGGVVVGMLGTNPVLYDVMGAKIASGYADNIARFRRDNESQKSLVEDNNAKTLPDELRKMGEPVMAITAKGNKKMRIGNTEHYFRKTKEQGGLLFHERLKDNPAWQAFIREYIYFPNARHEHILDALEMALTYIKRGKGGVFFAEL